MLTLHEIGSPIDPILLSQALDNAGILSEIGGPAYLASLIDGTPHFSNIRNYCEVVKKHAARRAIIRQGYTAMCQAADGDIEPEQIADALNAKLADATSDLRGLTDRKSVV